MNKHTPGPWEKKYDPSTHRIEVNAPDDGRCVCFIHVPPATGFDVCEANARLIAAAPDLLDACDFALTILMGMGNGNGDAANACRAAIAKVSMRGQSND